VSLQWQYNIYEAMTVRIESLWSTNQTAMGDMEASQSKIYKAFAALNG